MTSPAPGLPFYEASIVDGLEEAAFSELKHRFGGQARLLHEIGRFPGALQFNFDGNPARLLQLKTVLSLFLVQPFPVPRPRALMGHQHFTLLMKQIEAIRKLSPKNAYKTVYLAAAGAESKVMTRFLEEVAQAARLEPAYDEGDLLIRLRRPLDGGDRWEALIRLTPRPLSTRNWRVCDYKGALNAAVAHAIAQMTLPDPEDIFLNVACGSGSLLIERASHIPLKLGIGCDTNTEALECAQANLAASQRTGRILLAPWDATALPLADGSVDVVCSDLPFGHYVGTHQENLTLYPRLLDEAARVAKVGARGLFLTHEVRLMSDLLAESQPWETVQVITLALAGLHPRIYILRRR